LAFGIKITCTPGHRFLSKSGWKKAGMISSADEIMSAKASLPLFIRQEKIEQTEVFIEFRVSNVSAATKAAMVVQN